MGIQFELDYRYLMTDHVGAAHGLRADDITALQPLFNRIHQQIGADVTPGGKHRELGFFDLPDTQVSVADELVKTAAEFSGLADAHVVLGIGGSYLGARMLFEALCHKFHNELPADRRKAPRIYFEGNSVDNDAFVDLLDLLEGQPVTAHVVSKSGGTLETGMAFRLLRQRLGDRVAAWAVTTGHKTRLDRFVAQRQLQGLRVFDLPDNVGGRFSVLCPVGLFPAAMMGLDVHAILDGARAMRDRCAATADVLDNPAYLYAALQYLSLLRGRNISVLSVWSKCLESFGLWLDQLSAESLGKDGLGRTPLTAVCTRELHSRGQQHQEGTRDKVVCNLVAQRPGREPLAAAAEPGDDEERAIYASGRKPTKEEASATDGYFYAVGRSLPEINDLAYQATDTAYVKAQRPGMTMRIGAIDEAHLGALIFLFELATLVEGRLMGVNPLNQPGVQDYKDYLTGLLDAPGGERYGAECRALRSGDNPFVVRA